MVKFVYSAGSAIDDVQVLKNSTGGLRAYVHAAATARPEQLEKAKTILAGKHWKFVPTLHDGAPVLEVRGFKKNDELLKALSDGGVAGKVQHTEAQKGDTLTSKEKWSNRTAFGAGISYNVGDIAFTHYSISEYRDYSKKAKNAATTLQKAEMADNIKGAKFKILAGVGYALGGIILSGFASRDQSQNHIAKASKEIQSYLQDASIARDPSSSASIAVSKPQRSVLGKAYDKLTTYPSEALNIVYTGVGLLLMAAALKHRNAPQKAYETLKQVVERKSAETWDIGLGVVTAASSLTGLLVKETKFDEDHPKRTGVMGFVDWIREKPLRAVGYGYMVATAFHAKGTWDKWKTGDEQVHKNVIGRAVFVATNVISEILLAISSKGHGDGVVSDKSVESTVASIAAETLMRQPEAKREALLNQLAGHLSSSGTLGNNPQVIAGQINEHMKAVENNPWAKHFDFEQSRELRNRAPNKSAPEPSIVPKEPHKLPSNTISNVEYASNMKLNPSIQL